MSYKIEITADTITELTGKLLALAAATQPDVVSSTAHIVPIDTKPKRTGKAATSASTAAGTETKTDAVAVEPDTPSADTGSDTPTPLSEDAPSVEASTPKLLDFDREVAPVVLNAVKVKGKPWVQEILSQFGVERASQVPDEQFSELVDTLKAGVE